MTEPSPRKPNSTVQFTYHDPGRTFDGSPYEAAGQAITQVLGLIKLLKRGIKDAGIQVRNAYMQRNLDLGGDANAKGWEDSPESRIIAGAHTVVDGLEVKLTALQKSATFDPNNLPKE